MGVTYHLPSPPLDAYITCLWSCEGPAPYPRLTVLPMPSLHLMVNLGDAYHVYASGAGRAAPVATCVESWSVGLWNTSHVMDWPRDMRLVNVSFRPGGVYPFLRLPLCELRNQIVSLDAIWGGAAAEIRERLAAAPTPAARLALLERLLLARLARLGDAAHGLDPWLATVQQAVAAIARQRGVLSIYALSQQLGVSHKHLIAQFTRLVGGTPKELARIYRLKQVLYSLDPDPDPAQPLTWARVAHQAGYYDEAHFNRDFHAFTGHTPSEGLRLLRRVHAEHPEYGLYPKFLPAADRVTG
jgi:AraC-like DNA-binding protein